MTAPVVNITACRACARLRLLLDSRDHECSACHRRRVRAYEQRMARARLTTLARDDRLALLCGVILLALVVALVWGAR